MARCFRPPTSLRAPTPLDCSCVLSPSYHGDIAAEFQQFASLGVDGIFTDFPDAGSRALKQSPASSGR